MVAQIDQSYWATRRGKGFQRLFSWALLEGRPLTTRGRFINPLVFALYNLWERMPGLGNAAAPIFILGTGRSGTTILGVLLSMHRDVLFLNEPKAMWAHIHQGEDLIGSYRSGDAAYRLGAADADETRARALTRLYGAGLTLTGAARVVDKYPELLFRRDFVRAIFPDANFLILMRDGVDAVNSIESWSRRHGEDVSGEHHDWWGRDDRKWRLLVRDLVPEHRDLAPLQADLEACRDQRDRAAVEWIVSMREGARALGQEDGVLPVRYEDLASDPAGELARIVEFCGLQDDPVMTRYAVSAINSPSAPRALELHGDLVEPMRSTLATIGYEASCERVSARDRET